MILTEEQEQKLARAQEILDYRFDSEHLLLSAITHPSATEGKSVKYSYERLEFLGDSILGAIVAAIAEALARNHAENVVVDPVMVATSGARLIGDDAIEALKARLLPLADVVTPNMPEAAVLAGFEVVDETSMERAALRLAEAGTGAALVKGGHRHDRADDVLVTAEGDVVWLRAPRVDTENAHGTGCTLSSAIACGLAKGLPMEEAVRAAKDYVRGALAAGLNLGKGSGPLDHMWEY